MTTDADRSQPLAIETPSHDDLFDCTKDHDFDQVGDRYGDKKEAVVRFLKDACATGKITNQPHAKVHDMVDKEFGGAK